ncbi:LacI family DNA-binding transcriptional regulator [Microbacterium sp. cx-55]|uniref:LacI family DNA-binding transcriptional regulator n=1 Tax=unclassified Microbacterium TaxID=2609290 RepID=UPI001CBBA970|nr:MULTISPECIES: LacI family DNA-binding transcriptional regulator [unclassified Microbacterium]MBZ4486752.1 LacI family DNA-binding transcriptional regulator [Microbacterium sp. cx-55]MCC4907729.1 LacI family DNA-binding transcriptional regulator [Microbacterium sp. cx-59]UGB36291.1 LacI family DNA-binding transcriptional regulator [Microbacterium sp. cx-55]
MTRKAVGIKDVAREAGVSVTTVSHILNDVESARASDETRERVKTTAARLGYGANRIARSLRRQQSEMIGLLSEEIATTPHAGRIILGAQEAARKRGLTLVLINTSRDQLDIQRDTDALLRQQVDGVLYATMYHREIALPASLQAVPTVLIDSTSEDGRVPSVVPDEEGGAFVAVDELIRHGHRRIGFITNSDDVPATRGRLTGYRRALAGAGLEFDPTFVVADQSETPGGYKAAMEILGRPDRPTGLFCYNDRMAMGAYRAAAELGLRIPDDLSLVGFDNQELIAEGLYPALTTVALPHFEMGEWALEALATLMAGSEESEQPAVYEVVVLPCPLVRRQSVGAPVSSEGGSRE